MDTGPDDSIELDEQVRTTPGVNGRVLLLGLASGVLFAVGLLLTEIVGEIALDVDLKPFFVPYLLIVFSRSGLSTLSVGVGAALGEGVLDVFEGYELDDPIGFLGYVLGFVAFGWYLDEVAADPTRPLSLTIGALLGAFVQALFEGFAFLVFEETSGVVDATLSISGNTITHGFVLGAIPVVLLAPLLRNHVGTLP